MTEPTHHAPCKPGHLFRELVQYVLGKIAEVMAERLVQLTANNVIEIFFVHFKALDLLNRH